MNVKNFFPVVQINKIAKKAVFNEKAKQLFDGVQGIEKLIRGIKLNKDTDIVEIATKLYCVKIIKQNEIVMLIFSKLEDDVLKELLEKINVSPVVDTNSDLEKQKESLKAVLSKFLALKKRYGGFNVKFLYLKVEFTLDVYKKIRDELLEKIMMYTDSKTRNSDALGQLSEDSFGLILTNVTTDGANLVLDKILKYVSEVNVQNGTRLIQIKASLGHEMLILKYLLDRNKDFEDLVKHLAAQAEYVTIGKKLRECMK